MDAKWLQKAKALAPQKTTPMPKRAVPPLMKFIATLRSKRS